MSEKRISVAGIIRTRLPEFEQRMKSGEYQESIVKSLREEGIETTLASFRNLISRARNWHKKNAANHPGQDPIHPAPSVEKKESAEVTTQAPINKPRAIETPLDLKMARQSEPRLDPEELARNFQESQRRKKP